MILATATRPPLKTDVPHLWGRSVRELHDELWAAAGVNVVRRDTPFTAGHRMYLLLDADQLVHGPALEDDAKRRRGRIYRLTRGDWGNVHGCVVQDDAGRLVRIERRYADADPRGICVLMTADPEIARRWSAGATPRALARAQSRRRAVRCDGWLLDASDETQAARWLLVAVRDQRHMPPPGVMDVGENIWIREGAVIPEDALLIGPAWIGDGVALDDGICVAGPCVLPDCDPAAGRSTRPLAGPALLTPPPVEPSGPGWWLLGGKRLFDIVVALCVLAMLTPLAPLIMALIHHEDGRPYFFAHTRQMRGGHPFKCYKFRTMVQTADEERRRLSQANLCDGPQFYIPDDPRLLRCGDLLRKLHIDELPQFWNVLRGEMSVVGPRPSPESENQYCRPWREARLSVRPGITGLWQVHRTRDHGRDFQEWIRYDFEYVRRVTLFGDLKVIYLTIAKVAEQIMSRRRGSDDDRA